MESGSIPRSKDAVSAMSNVKLANLLAISVYLARKTSTSNMANAMTTALVRSWATQQNRPVLKAAI
jgi:hypothetical protein